MTLPAAELAAQNDPTESAGTVEVYRITASIRVDGRLNEPAWAAAEPLPLAYEWFPGDNTPAMVRAVCQFGFDDRILYIGCTAWDPHPEQIRARYGDRDQDRGDDLMCLLLDPLGSRRRGFRFCMNPLGVQTDALFSEETGLDEDWDAIWQSAGQVTDFGYVVEMGIPFRTLRFSRDRTAPAWRLLVSRDYPRSTPRTMGSVPMDRNNNCMLCQANVVRGLRHIVAGRDLELQPTVTGIWSGMPSDDERTLTVGGTGSWGITSRARVNLVANPDFSQVEADAAEFEINRRFALTFPEKRPFFLSGADFFDVSEDLVFTRSVADPIAGAKFTGGWGLHSLGVFATRDRLTNLLFPGNQDSERFSLAEDVNTVVARYRRDLLNSSSLGVLTTLRTARDYVNVVSAGDGTIRLGSAHRVRFTAAASKTDYPELAEAETGRTGALTGAAANVRYEWETHRWALEATYRGIGKAFRADVGRLQRVDLQGPEVQLTHTAWGDRSRAFDRIRITLEGQHLTDLTRAVIDQKVQVTGRYEGPLQTAVRIDQTWRRIAFADRLFGIWEQQLQLSVQPSGTLAMGLSLGGGNEIDADNARLAKIIRLQPSMSLSLGRAFTLDIDYRFERLAANREEIFSGHLTQAHLEYHFSLRAFVRLITQYRRIRRNPAQFLEAVDPVTTRWFGQFLFTYRVNPRTLVFLGCSGSSEDTGLRQPFGDRATLFLKLAYALRR